MLRLTHHLLRRNVQPLFSAFNFNALRAFSTSAPALAGVSQPKSAFDLKNVYKSYSKEDLTDLLRAFTLLSLTQVKVLMDNHQALFKTGRVVLGKTGFEYLIKMTIFKQFIAGITEDEVIACMNRLGKHNIGGILDYAVEADLQPANGTVDLESKFLKADALAADKRSTLDKLLESDKQDVSKFYCLEIDTFKESVDRIMFSCQIAGQATGRPAFIAIKLTSLGDTTMIKNANSVVFKLKQLFASVTAERVAKAANPEEAKQFMTKDEFVKAFLTVVPHETKETAEAVFAKFTDKANKHVLLYDFIEVFHPKHDLQRVYKLDHKKSYLPVLNQEELKLFNEFRGRIHYICAEAKKKAVRVMIDAEQSYFQHEIHNLAIECSRAFNGDSFTVYNTYQGYLKGCYDQMVCDRHYAEHNKRPFQVSAKLVRGAYHEQERALAKQHNYESPICETYEDTNKMYNKSATVLLGNILKEKAAIILASHNFESVRLMADAMEKNGLKNNNTNIMFAQLLGMSGFITNTLAENGYNTYKYLPYGPVGETLPYLVRRISENKSVLHKVKYEALLIQCELARRMGMPNAYIEKKLAQANKIL